MDSRMVDPGSANPPMVHLWATHMDMEGGDKEDSAVEAWVAWPCLLSAVSRVVYYSVKCWMEMASEVEASMEEEVSMAAEAISVVEATSKCYAPALCFFFATCIFG